MRALLALVGFFAFVVMYMLRVNMSVAMVCMINQTALHLQVQEYQLTLDGANETIVLEAVESVPKCANTNSNGGNKTSRVNTSN